MIKVTEFIDILDLDIKIIILLIINTFIRARNPSFMYINMK